MPTISLVMITKNEEKTLSRCLESARSLVDEIVIVDTGSTDKTKQIAKSFDAKVYDFSWINDFSAARNFALDQATGDWCLILDADEYIVGDCKYQINQFINNEQAAGRIKLIDKFSQDGEVRYSKSYLSRLFPRGVYYSGKIHEQIITTLERKNVDIDVFHDGYFEKDKTGRNLEFLMKELHERPDDDYILYQIGKQYKLKESFFEAEMYFEKSYRIADTSQRYRQTLVVNLLYTIIKTKHFNLGLEIIDKEKLRLAKLPDFHFACGLFYMELIFNDIKTYIHLFPLIEESFLICINIGETEDYDSVKGTGSFFAYYNLGVVNELLNNKEKAIDYYTKASDFGYERAKNRLELLK